jgi:hypothetical protein
MTVRTGSDAVLGPPRWGVPEGPAQRDLRTIHVLVRHRACSRAHQTRQDVRVPVFTPMRSA